MFADVFSENECKLLIDLERVAVHARYGVRHVSIRDLPSQSDFYGRTNNRPSP